MGRTLVILSLSAVLLGVAVTGYSAAPLLATESSHNFVGVICGCMLIAIGVMFATPERYIYITAPCEPSEPPLSPSAIINTRPRGIPQPSLN